MNNKERFLRLSALNRKARKHTLSNREIRERDRLRRIIRRKIANVHNDYAVWCLTCRYLDGMMWDDVADTLGHSASDAVRKICERTIEKM